jgi:hypothetical protein
MTVTIYSYAFLREAANLRLVAIQGAKLLATGQYQGEDRGDMLDSTKKGQPEMHGMSQIVGNARPTSSTMVLWCCHILAGSEEPRSHAVSVLRQSAR